VRVTRAGTITHLRRRNNNYYDRPNEMSLYSIYTVVGHILYSLYTIIQHYSCSVVFIVIILLLRPERIFVPSH